MNFRTIGSYLSMTCCLGRTYEQPVAWVVLKPGLLGGYNLGKIVLMAHT